MMSKWLSSLFLTWLIPAGAAAQVGHDPADSPFRDIRNRTNFVATAWRVTGGGGSLDVGPRSGEGVGVRYEMRLNGPTDAFLEGAWTRLERLVINPDVPEADRVSGPVDQSVILVDAGLSVLLGGNKTWNGFAPYVGGSLGLAFGSDIAADSSGFTFNAKFVSGPHLGVRWYASSALSFRLEGRLLFWQLKYPSTFFDDPRAPPGAPPVLSQATDPDSEWTSHPALTIAVGYAVRL